MYFRTRHEIQLPSDIHHLFMTDGIAAVKLKDGDSCTEVFVKDRIWRSTINDDDFRLQCFHNIGKALCEKLPFSDELDTAVRTDSNNSAFLCILYQVRRMSSRS